MCCMNSYAKAALTNSKGLFVKLVTLGHMAFLLPNEGNCDNK